MQNKKTRSASPAPGNVNKKAKEPATGAFGFAWWVKNILLAIVVAFFLPRIVRSNPSYLWLIENYAKQNLELIKGNPDLTFDQKMQAKLGSDYSFLMYLRDNTPATAVIYYPSRKQMTDSINGQPSVFQGNLCDKLSAVRILYPRRVVVEQELGRTSWSRKLTHAGIVGRHGKDLLHYAVDSTYTIGVLPLRQEDLKQPNR